MIIQPLKNINEKELSQLILDLENSCGKIITVKTNNNIYLLTSEKTENDIRKIGAHKLIQDIHYVNDSYQLVSNQWKVKPTTIDLGDGIKIGDSQLNIMAGPCSIENEAQIESVASHLSDNNISIMRGGVFKPRSSPYAFRGLGIDGLKLFNKICREKGIKIITEVMQVSQIDDMYDYVDIFQVGARNSQNFNLLDALGKQDKPVLLKRGISGTIDELLHSAEYIFSAGNEKIIFCERGIRTFENAYRNTFDINAIQVLKQKTHLPVIADPSHGVGIRSMVPAIALSSIMAGADGVIYEVHPEPEKAMSDGQQTLNYEESKKLIHALRKTHELIKKEAFELF